MMSNLTTRIKKLERQTRLLFIAIVIIMIIINNNNMYIYCTIFRCCKGPRKNGKCVQYSEKDGRIGAGS